MEKIQAAFILEMMGRPKPHVAESIKAIVEKLSKEKGVSIISKTVHEPKEVEGSNSLFSTFADLEVEFDRINDLFGVIFGYMPSHIEIIYPDNLSLTNLDLNDFANSVVKRLHNYDAITKRTVYERDILLQKLKEVSPESFSGESKEKPKKQPSNKKTKKKSPKKKTKKS